MPHPFYHDIFDTNTSAQTNDIKQSKHSLPKGLKAHNHFAN